MRHRRHRAGAEQLQLLQTFERATAKLVVFLHRPVIIIAATRIKADVGDETDCEEAEVVTKRTQKVRGQPFFVGGKRNDRRDRVITGAICTVRRFLYKGQTSSQTSPRRTCVPRTQAPLQCLYLLAHWFAFTAAAVGKTQPRLRAFHVGRRGHNRPDPELALACITRAQHLVIPICGGRSSNGSRREAKAGCGGRDNKESRQTVSSARQWMYGWTASNHVSRDKESQPGSTHTQRALSAADASDSHLAAPACAASPPEPQSRPSRWLLAWPSPRRGARAAGASCQHATGKCTACPPPTGRFT